MKIALIGYGKMGKEIETIAKNRNHSIELIIDVNNIENFTIANLKNCDVAIEFTKPDAAYQNVLKCFEANLPVVSGTTGWLEKMEECKKICLETERTFFYATNFSVGVNLVFKLNQFFARLMNNFENYEVTIAEVHHTQKLDAPSGTAITLANDIIANLDRKSHWSKEIADSQDSIPIHSVREGKVTGTHTIRYESEIDFIEMTHFAKNRQGFALGSVLAAEFIANKTGFFSMNDLLKF